MPASTQRRSMIDRARNPGRRSALQGPVTPGQAQGAGPYNPMDTQQMIGPSYVDRFPVTGERQSTIGAQSQGQFSPQQLISMGANPAEVARMMRQGQAPQQSAIYGPVNTPQQRDQFSTPSPIDMGQAMGPANRVRDGLGNVMERQPVRDFARDTQGLNRSDRGTQARIDAVINNPGTFTQGDSNQIQGYHTTPPRNTGLLPEHAARGQSALQGDYGASPSNANPSMLTPSLPAGMLPPTPTALDVYQQPTHGGLPAPRTSVGGGNAPVAGGYTPVLSPDLNPSLAVEAQSALQDPGSQTWQDMSGIDRARARAQDPREGGEFVASRGPYASSYRGQITPEQLEENRQSAITRRRESKPLPGMPRLPHRMGAEGRQSALENRQRLTQPGARRGFQSSIPQSPSEVTTESPSPSANDLYTPGAEPQGTVAERQTAYQQAFVSHADFATAAEITPEMDVNRMAAQYRDLDSPSESDLKSLEALLIARSATDPDDRAFYEEMLSEKPGVRVTNNANRPIWNQIRAMHDLDPLPAVPQPPINERPARSGFGNIESINLWD